MTALQNRASLGGVNVAIPQGDLYPNGLPLDLPDANVQSTVRPGGWLFVQSPGYNTVRVGRNRYQHPEGLGIHFTPIRLAESAVVGGGTMLVADGEASADHVDIADLPNSDQIGADGMLSAHEVATNGGVKIAEGTDHPHGMGEHPHLHMLEPRNMGERVESYYRGILRNPVGVLKQDWQRSPVAAVMVAASIVGIGYVIVSDLERSYKSRASGGGTGRAVAAAPAATVATAGREADRVTTVASTAVQEVANAAGGAVEEVGQAVRRVTEAVADEVAE